MKYYNRTNTCDCGCGMKLTSGDVRREYDMEGNWTGRWLHKNCCQRFDYKNNPENSKRLLKSLADCRNKQLSKETNTGKGFIGEQIFCRTRGAENCNLKLDNWNSKIDIKDNEFGKVQVKTPSLSYDGRWVTTHIKGCFDNLVILCMSRDFKHVKRVYIIPEKDILFQSVNIRIYVYGHYEQFRVDEKIYDDAYHSMNIEDCAILR